jgi:hypothetical protein
MTHLPNLQLHLHSQQPWANAQKEKTEVSQARKDRRLSSGGATQVIFDDDPTQDAHPSVRGVPHTDPDVETPKDETSKEPRRAPTKVALPERGIWGARYKLSCKLNFPDHGYKRLTANDRLLQEIGIGEEYLLALSNVPGMEFSYTTANNQGGSSKTNNAVYPGSIISRVTHVVVYLVPATANTKTARAALAAGVSPKTTLKISEFAKLADELREFTKLDQLVQRNAYGLRVIANDPSITITIDSKFGKAGFLRVARVLEDKATVRIFDQGNDNVSTNELGLEATRRADLMLTPATIGHLMSQYGLSETLEAYMADATRPDQFDETVPELARISTRWKAENSLVVMNKLAKGMDPKEFRRYTMRLDGVGHPVGSLGWHGDFLTIEDDPYIADPSPETIKVDLEAIQRTTYRDYLMEALMIFVKVGRQRGMTLPEPSPRLVDLWQRRGMKPINLRPVPAPMLAKP